MFSFIVNKVLLLSTHVIIIVDIMLTAALNIVNYTSIGLFVIITFNTKSTLKTKHFKSIIKGILVIDRCRDNLFWHFICINIKRAMLAHFISNL